MLCGAGFGLCLLHVSPESSRAVPGRTSCHRCPGLWEPRCCCPARAQCEGYGHTVSRASPIPFSFFAVVFYEVSYMLYFCCTSVVLVLLTLGAALSHCTNHLCPVPCWPLPVPFACLAAALQCKFLISFRLLRLALTLAVPRSSLPPWPFFQRALLTLSRSSMRTSLAAAMRTSSSMSGAALRRWGRRPRRTAKMDRRRRVENKLVDLASNQIAFSKLHTCPSMPL